jgi:hypothetical protein
MRVSVGEGRTHEPVAHKGCGWMGSRLQCGAGISALRKLMVAFEVSSRPVPHGMESRRVQEGVSGCEVYT